MPRKTDNDNFTLIHIGASSSILAEQRRLPCTLHRLCYHFHAGNCRVFPHLRFYLLQVCAWLVRWTANKPTSLVDRIRTCSTIQRPLSFGCPSDSQSIKLLQVWVRYDDAMSYTRIMIIQTISNSYSIKDNWRFSFGFQLLGHVSGSAHISPICYNSFLRHETSNASRRPPPNSGAFFGRSHHLWIPLFYIKEAITKVKLHWRPTD